MMVLGVATATTLWRESPSSCSAASSLLALLVPGGRNVAAP